MAMISRVPLPGPSAATRRAAAVLLACACALPARAQQPPAAPAAAAPAGCPAPQDLPPAALVGLWHAEFGRGQPPVALLLELHAEHAGSLAGALVRDGARSRVAADLDDGAFTLEESPDGQRIAATWLGELVAGSCGREIRGEWRPREGAARSFVLRRVGNW